MTTVIHRDGNITPVDISRIKQVVDWACFGLTPINPLELEAVFSARLKGEISTNQIQENLINHALELCSPTEPNWRYVAGRLYIWNLWKQVRIARSMENYEDIYQNSFIEIKRKIVAGIYSPVLLEGYSLDEIKESVGWIDQELDKDYDYAGAKLLHDRYLLANELPQEAFLVSALIAASNSKEPLVFAKKIYQAIAQRKISLATPMLANLRRPNTSVTSCFIIDADDSLESIAYSWTQSAKISAQGGGIGIRLSRIRAIGATVNGRPNSSGGVVPWIKILNDIVLAVNQGGKRAGAMTVALDSWHLDLPAFLDMQTEHGDQRLKAFDIFPQVVCSDLFMTRVINNDTWTLVDPHEVKTQLGIELAGLWGWSFQNAYNEIEAHLGSKLKLYKTVKAKELFKEIMRLQLETGLPYLSFKDTINQANPNKDSGTIPSVNLCTESFSNVSVTEAHCCDLVSLNLANIYDDELEEITAIAVELLDNALDIATPSIPEAAKHHKKYRVLGVGAMGLADWLASRKLSYKNNQQEINDLFENIAYAAYKTSIDLASERGAFAAYKKSEYNKDLINCKPYSWYEQNSNQPDRWRRLFEKLAEYGIRNSQLLAIAPNTSSSLIQGCTASILPTYNRFFFDKAKGNLPIAPPFIDEYFWYYEENRNLDQQIIINTVANIQKWIDTGISMELLFNLNHGLTGKDIFRILTSAWQQKIKAIYYVRTVQKDNFIEAECSACAN